MPGCRLKRDLEPQARDDPASVQAKFGDLLDPWAVVPWATKSGEASRCFPRLLAGRIPVSRSTLMLPSSKLTHSTIAVQSVSERRREHSRTLPRHSLPAAG